MISKLTSSSTVSRTNYPVAKPSQEDKAPIDGFCEGQPAWGQSLTGDIRYHQVPSQVLHNDRGVWVYLPPSYQSHPEKSYPVLYVNDGQNVFERGTAFGGREWQVDEAAQRLMKQNGMQEAIIVAVSNAGADRMNEYTPVADPEYGGGKAKDYAKFLIEELKPSIDSAYRTEKGPETTGIMGSSLGGLVSLYVAFNNPGTFGVCGALSPSLWWAGKDMIGHISKLPPQQNPQRVWVDMGTKESPSDQDHNGVPDTLDNTRELVELLEKRGFNQPGQPHLRYWEVPGAAHNEASWAARMDTVLPALFPSQP